MKDLFKNYKTEELVSMYQLTSEETYLEEILNRNKGLLYHWIQKYDNIPYLNGEDLYSEACLSLWQAVCNFNPEKEVAFTTFLKISVFQKFNRIYNEVTRKKRYAGSSPISWEELVSINKETSPKSCVEDLIWAKCFINSIEDNKLKHIALSLFLGDSKSIIAQRLGVSNATINYHVQRLQRLITRYIG